MNRIGKLFLLGVLVSLTVASTSVVKAEEIQAVYSETLSEAEIDLLNELTILDPTHDDIDGEIVSVSKIKVSEADLTASEIEDYPAVQPFGAIQNNYMTMYVTVTRTTNDPGFDRFHLYSYFQWDKQPFFAKNDGIALAWSDNFTLVNSQVNFYYEAIGSYDKSGWDNTNAYLSGVKPEVGVGYTFPFLNNKVGYRGYLHHGTIRANVRKHDSTGSANVVAKYVHSTLGLSGPSFSFDSSGPSIGVSISSTYDSREVYTSWNY